MRSAEERLAELQRILDLLEAEGGFELDARLQEEAELLVIGDWALMGWNTDGELALAFHRQAHPVDVAQLTRFLVEQEIDFEIQGAFVVTEDDEIVFESEGPSFEP